MIEIVIAAFYAGAFLSSFQSAASAAACKKFGVKKIDNKNEFFLKCGV